MPRTLQDVADAMEIEGFDYCFRLYSDFEDVDDPEFHRLRVAYKSAAEELLEYIEDNADVWDGEDDDEVEDDDDGEEE